MKTIAILRRLRSTIRPNLTYFLCKKGNSRSSHRLPTEHGGKQNRPPCVAAWGRRLTLRHLTEIGGGVFSLGGGHLMSTTSILCHPHPVSLTLFRSSTHVLPRTKLAHTGRQWRAVNSMPTFCSRWLRWSLAAVGHGAGLASPTPLPPKCANALPAHLLTHPVRKKTRTCDFFWETCFSSSMLRPKHGGICDTRHVTRGKDTTEGAGARSSDRKKMYKKSKHHANPAPTSPRARPRPGQACPPPRRSPPAPCRRPLRSAPGCTRPRRPAQGRGVRRGWGGHCPLAKNPPLSHFIESQSTPSDPPPREAPASPSKMATPGWVLLG